MHFSAFMRMQYKKTELINISSSIMPDLAKITKSEKKKKPSL